MHALSISFHATYIPCLFLSLLCFFFSPERKLKNLSPSSAPVSPNTAPCLLVAYNYALTQAFYVEVGMACIGALWAVWLLWQSTRTKKKGTDVS